MVNRWRAMPPFARLWLTGAAVWFPLIMLEVVLGILFGGTRAWTPIYVSLIVIGVVTGGTCWVLGTIQAFQFARARRQQTTSGSPPGPGLP